MRRQEMSSSTRRSRWPEFAWIGGFAAALGAVTVVTGTIPTTLRDFFQPGTQPETLMVPVFSAMDCTGCHSDYAEDQEPWRRWSGSMMAQAARDPMMWAGLAV